MSILDVREVSVNFGGNMAVNAVSLSVGEGEIVGLIGPNGAGKTTTFNVITGLQAPTRGTIRLDGDDITKLAAHKRARRGMARTFQRLELFGSLTVRDNLRTAAELHRRSGDDPADVADAIAAQVGLAEVRDQRADSLSTGMARLVELGRSLACRPRVLLLDEPASGLDEHETDTFAGILRSLADDGLAILLVEHDVPLVMRLCEQITVLNFGTVLASGSASEVQRDPAVIDAYLGQEAGIS